MMEAVPCIVGSQEEEMQDGGGVDEWRHGFLEYLWGTEGTLLGRGFDHLPSKGSLPKKSGCFQSGWCGNSWDECSLQRPPQSCHPLYQLVSLGFVRKDVSKK